MLRIIRNVVLVFLAIPIIAIAVLLLYAEWIWGGRIQTSLDAQYVPTAQALVQNPVPTPSLIHIEPAPGNVVESRQNICANVKAWELSVDSIDIGEWTRIYVNGSPAPDLIIGYVGELSSSLGAREIVQFCTSPELEDGLHIIEIRVGTSISALLNTAEARSYMWAYRVE
jgi:hypothetical protein